MVWLIIAVFTAFVFIYFVWICVWVCKLFCVLCLLLDTLVVFRVCGFYWSIYGVCFACRCFVGFTLFGSCLGVLILAVVLVV